MAENDLRGVVVAGAVGGPSEERVELVVVVDAVGLAAAAGAAEDVETVLDVGGVDRVVHEQVGIDVLRRRIAEFA